MNTPRAPLYITGPDHTIADIHNLSDCDAAISELITIIADIEVSLTDPSAPDNRDWRRGANRALSLRRAALTQVYIMRKEFRHDVQHDWNRKFVDAVKSVNPTLFYELVGQLNAVEQREAA